jgi:hypothetical protein
MALKFSTVLVLLLALPCIAAIGSSPFIGDFTDLIETSIIYAIQI